MLYYQGSDRLFLHHQTGGSYFGEWQSFGCQKKGVRTYGRNYFTAGNYYAHSECGRNDCIIHGHCQPRGRQAAFQCRVGNCNASHHRACLLRGGI